MAADDWYVHMQVFRLVVKVQFVRYGSHFSCMKELTWTEYEEASVDDFSKVYNLM